MASDDSSADQVMKQAAEAVHHAQAALSPDSGSDDEYQLSFEISASRQ
jgi:hypothetical protein